MVLNKLQLQRGSSLVEVLIVSAIILLVFGGLLSGFQYSLDLIANSRAKLTALTVASDQMEYIRSLSYDAVGTEEGLPPGAIPQKSEVTLNKILFTEKTLIRYVDSPADGLLDKDINGITTDYKEAIVTVSWSQRGVAQELFLVSIVIPRSIETNVGGGTVRVRVFDSTVTPLAGADVRLFNNSGTTTVDMTMPTNTTGEALFGGAPAGVGYQVFVSAPGYSKDQTYVVTESLPQPNIPVATVAEAGVTTLSFFIDRLSTLQLTTLATKNEASSTEQFSNVSGIVTSTNIEVSGGQAVLSSTSGVYADSGIVYLASTTPATVAQWSGILVSGSVPADASRRLSVYTLTGTSTYTLIPDSDLPGNSSGFTGTIIPLASLSVTTYPSISLGITLTTNTAVTPAVDEISVWYVSSQTTWNNLSIIVTGVRTINNADSAPVYKNVYSTTTNSSGVRTLNGVEYDTYTVTSSGLDVSEACLVNPIPVLANTTVNTVYTLVTNSTNSLRVTVNRPDGTPLPNATVKLSDGGASQTRTTGWCGQVFFPSLNTSTTYNVTVTAPGYGSNTQTDFNISGDVINTVTMYTI